MASPNPSAKEAVKRLLEELPEDASFEEIQYRIYVREKVDSGLSAARDGRTMTHEEFLARMTPWLVR